MEYLVDSPEQAIFLNRCVQELNVDQRKPLSVKPVNSSHILNPSVQTQGRTPIPPLSVRHGV